MKKVTVIATGTGFDGTTVRVKDDEFQMPANVFDKRPKLDDKGKPTGEMHDAPSWFKAKPVSASAPAPEEVADLA